jgi:hypothetical protein
LAERCAKEGYWQDRSGGSVLLETVAPPEATIHRVSRNEDRYGEVEYLIDRRRLQRVRKLAKFPQKLLLTEEVPIPEPEIIGFGKEQGG